LIQGIGNQAQIFHQFQKLKKMSLGPTLLSKIQLGDCDQIKGFPKIRRDFSKALKLFS